MFHNRLATSELQDSTCGFDHWGRAGSIFFAGAGTPAGQVIGATDKHAADVTTHGCTPADILRPTLRPRFIAGSELITPHS